jgi:hypothetical protein
MTSELVLMSAAAQQPRGAVESAPNQHLAAAGYQAHQAQNTRHGSFGIKSF